MTNPQTRIKCTSKNKLIDIRCRKCGHRQCSTCEKYVMNSELIQSNDNFQPSESTSGSLEGQSVIDVGRRMTDAYLIDWEEFGEVVMEVTKS